MRVLLRPPQLFILISYLALSALPFVPLLPFKPTEQPWQLVGLEVLAWMAVWALFKRPAYFHWLLLPAFLMLPVELYIRVCFSQPLSPHHIGLLAESSPREALEFMGNKVWGVAAVLLGAFLWWALTYVAAWRGAVLGWSGRWRRIAFALTAAAASVFAYGCEFGIAGVYQNQQDGWGAPVKGAHLLGPLNLPPLPNVVLMAGETPFRATRPFGMAGLLAAYAQEQRKLAGLAANAAGFRFQASQPADSAPQTIVVVIGESSRFDRWGLNGSARDTNPLLSQEPNLVVLSNVVTPVAATRLSVPLIMSRKPASESWQEKGFREKTFLSAFKEAGYRTWWLSNQLTVGDYDTPIAALAREADEVQHLNLGSYNDQSSFDDVLLAPLQRALAAPAPHKLIVLHTLGSHWNYARRYPARFNYWQPSLTGIERPQIDDPANQALILNSFDNSVRYTDWLLAQVIGQLKQQGQSSALLYVSDHGEVLSSQGCHKFLHGQGTLHDYHVPAMAWYSSQYRARHPDKVAQLERHRAEPIGTPDIFHTVLDAADIRYPDQHLEWSFLQKGYTPRKRLVFGNEGAGIDYDTAVSEGACQVLTQPRTSNTAG